jgi:hypothetical protein
MGVTANLLQSMRNLQSMLQEVSDTTIRLLDQHWDKWVKSPQAKQFRKDRIALLTAPEYVATKPEWYVRPMNARALEAKEKYKPDMSLPAILGGKDKKKKPKTKTADSAPSSPGGNVSSSSSSHSIADVANGSAPVSSTPPASYRKEEEEEEASRADRAASARPKTPT